ncbi:MAG: hypothetical protein ACI935_001212 [Moritella dasanensis]
MLSKAIITRQTRMKKTTQLLLMASMSLPLTANTEAITQFKSTVGARYFQEENINNSDDSSLFLKIEAELEADYNQIEFRGKLFSSLDQHDDKRNYLDVRQSALSYRVNEVTLSGGVNTFFWGVSETINILNTLNQIDFRESIDGKAKMGQTFVALDYEQNSNTTQILYLPDFRAIDYPDRPSPSIKINDAAFFESGADNGDFAIRSNWALDETEFSIAYFNGTRRDPLLLPTANFTSLTPYYIKTEYFAFDGIVFIHDVTLKAEVKVGEELNERYYAHNIGVEYSYYPDSDIIQNIVWVAEHLLDDRKEQAETIGQNDIFFGAKVDAGELNEFNIRAILGIDLDNQSKYVDLSLAYRINDHLNINFKSNQFVDISGEDSRLALIKDEDFTEVNLHYAF